MCVGLVESLGTIMFLWHVKVVRGLHSFHHEYFMHVACKVLGSGHPVKCHTFSIMNLLHLILRSRTTKAAYIDPKYIYIYIYIYSNNDSRMYTTMTWFLFHCGWN